MGSKHQDEKQLLESYRRVKQTYDAFRKLQTMLGKPRRDFFSSDVTAKDESGMDLFEEIKRSKKKMNVNV